MPRDRMTQVVEALRGGPLWSIEDAEAAGGAPSAPGFYAWWATFGAVPELRGARHPSEPCELLYVGIAPSRAASSATLRSRLLGQHVGGNIAASTFRLGLAALLWEAEGWTPRRTTSGRYRLDREDDNALRTWQRAHLRLRWTVVREPWLLEADVVGALAPPMNREHNDAHSFFATMGASRARFRAVARAT